MKAQTTLLVSVVLNVGLAVAAAYVFTKSSSNPVSSISSTATTGAFGSSRKTAVSNVFETNTAIVTQTAESNFNWRLVESPEYKTYIANLRAIKCPEQTIRDIIVADVNKLYAQKFRALRQAIGISFQYWQAENRFNKASRDFWKQQNALEKEKSNLLKELLGVDPIIQRQREDGLRGERHISFLPEEKQNKMRDLQEKYREQTEKIYERMTDRSIDAAQQKELGDLKKKYLADAGQILTPEEFQEYEMRSSSIGNQMRRDLDIFDPTEEEFRKIFAARQKYEDDLTLLNPDDEEAQARRRKAQDESNKEIKEILGDDRYSDYARNQNSDYRQLQRLAARLDIPKESAQEVYDMKKTAETAAREIRDNESLSQQEREAALKAIQEETQKAVTEKLGERGYTNYKNRGGSWIKNLAH